MGTLPTSDDPWAELTKLVHSRVENAQLRRLVKIVTRKGLRYTLWTSLGGAAVWPQVEEELVRDTPLRAVRSNHIDTVMNNKPGLQFELVFKVA